MADDFEVNEGDFGGAFDDVISNRDDSDDDEEESSGGSGSDSTSAAGRQDERPRIEDDSDSSDVPAGNTPDSPSSPVGSSGANFADDPVGGSSGGSGGSSGSDDAVEATDPTKSTDSGLNTDNDSTPAGFQEPPEGVQREFEEQQSRQSGSGIGPAGVSGSEASTPDAETDAPTNDSTEGIEATKTGELETSDSDFSGQAQTLEERLTGTKVTDAVDGLNTTGAEFRREDIQVVRDGDTLRAELSPVGRERVGNIAERQTDEAAERAIERDLNTAFTNQDVTVDNSGNVGVSRNVQNEATEQGIAAANPGVRESDVTFQNGEARVERNRSDPQQRVAEQVASDLGISQGDDFTVSRTAPSSRVPTSTGQGDVRVNITQTGAQEIRGRREQEEGDIFTGAVAAVERSPGTAINTGALLLSRDVDSNARFDTPGEGSLIGRGREDEANANEDRFGEDLDIPFTDIGFVSGSDAAADAVEQRVISPVSEVAGDVSGSSQTGVGIGVGLLTSDPDAFGEETFNQSEQELRDIPRSEENEVGEENAGEVIGEGATSGALGIANVPRVANAVFEAGSFTVEAGEETVEGDGGEFAQEATEAGALRAGQGAEFAASNPLRFSSQLAGGAIASSSLIRLGRFAGGPSGGRAASTLVQPGEEAAIFAARRGVPGTRRLAGLVGDVDVGQGRRFLSDEGGQLGQSRSRGSSESESSGSSSGGTTITAEDLANTQARSSDLTRGGRFGSEPSGGRQPEATTDVPSAGEPSSLGFRSARTEQERGGTAAESNRKPNQDLREQAEARQVTEPEAQTGAIENTAVGLLRGTEAEVGQDVTAGQEARQEAAQRPFAGTRVDSLLNSGPRTEPGVTNRVEPFVGTRLESRLETRVETGTEARQDTRQESRQEVRQETRIESRAESRIEPRTEFRFDTRRETDFDDDRAVDGDESGRFPGLTGDSEEVVTLFRNPLTGDVLDDSADGGSSVPGFGSSDSDGPDLGGFGL